jgi:hypothetical protein
MLERDDAPRTSEQLSQEILQFAQEAQFGTPQYLAINDQLDLHEMVQEIRKSEKPDIELQIGYALVEERIKLGESRIEGYSKAYSHIVDLEDKLGAISTEEAIKRYKNEDEIISYMNGIYNTTLSKAREIIAEKRQ